MFGIVSLLDAFRIGNAADGFRLETFYIHCLLVCMWNLISGEYLYIFMCLMYYYYYYCGVLQPLLQMVSHFKPPSFLFCSTLSCPSCFQACFKSRFLHSTLFLILDFLPRSPSIWSFILNLGLTLLSCAQAFDKICVLSAVFSPYFPRAYSL